VPGGAYRRRREEAAMSKRRSPQEKKRLSYSRDRRNCYGENDKSSRRNIARGKRRNRRTRRYAEQRPLAELRGPVDERAVELVEDRLVLARRSERWRKWPDCQLGQHIAHRLAHRVEDGMSDPLTERVRGERVRRGTSSDGRGRWPG
jgi:hypothetical protein